MATLDDALHAATYLQMKPVIIEMLVDFALQNLCVETCIDILFMGDLYALKHLENQDPDIGGESGLKPSAKSTSVLMNTAPSIFWHPEKE